MEIKQIISEWKRSPKAKHKEIKRGFKRVQAIVDIHGTLVTRHIDIKKEN